MADFSLIERPHGSFQDPPPTAALMAALDRILGEGQVAALVELGDGSYNNTLEIRLVGGGACIVKVAPAPERQFRFEAEMLRNECAATHLLAVLDELSPRILGSDFTHEIIGRDLLLESLLPGTVGSQAIGRYDPSLLPGFYRQLATISRRIHAVTGEGFGPAAAPQFTSWSQALSSSLEDMLVDLAACSLPSADVAALSAFVDREGGLFDEISCPSLLHGDLWTMNVTLADNEPLPRVLGVFDCERSLFGDPMADWVVYRADSRKEPGEREAFWEAYGGRDQGEGAMARQKLYEGWHLAAVRLESFRHGDTAMIGETLSRIDSILGQLR